MEYKTAVIKSKIQTVLTECEDIVAAYLFGSSAAGRMRPGSDIDIAILLDETKGDIPKRKLLFDQLLPPLCRALRADVHLLFLNDASFLVRVQVFSKGKVLYVRDHWQHALFRMKSTALYADFAPYSRMTRKGLQNRLGKAYGR